MATDLAFETDARGRFVFVIPDTALDWPAGVHVAARAIDVAGRVARQAVVRVLDQREAAADGCAERVGQRFLKCVAL